MFGHVTFWGEFGGVGNNWISFSRAVEREWSSDLAHYINIATITTATTPPPPPPPKKKNTNTHTLTHTHTHTHVDNPIHQHHWSRCLKTIWTITFINLIIWGQCGTLKKKKEQSCFITLASWTGGMSTEDACSQRSWAYPQSQLPTGCSWTHLYRLQTNRRFWLKQNRGFWLTQNMMKLCCGCDLGNDSGASAAYSHAEEVVVLWPWHTALGGGHTKDPSPRHKEST